MQDVLEKYRTYQLSDFLGDDNFIRSVQYPDDYSGITWHQLLDHFPEKSDVISEAREIAIALGAWVEIDKEDRREPLWNQIVTTANSPRKPSLLVALNGWKKVAAVAAVFAVIVFSVYQFFLHTEKVEKTGYGNRMVVNLPDESVLMLNRNSSVTYSRLWNASRSREISMTGEVDFTVKHTAIEGRTTEADSFRVNVSDLRITVLGTAFNVRNRRGKTAISLRQGKLRIDFVKAGLPSIYLQPGEQYLYDTAAPVHQAQNANVDAAAAWKKNTLVLEGTSFAEIVSLLEDEYGYQVELSDTALLKRKLRGSVPMKDISNLFFILKNILDVNIEQQGNKLVITDR